MGVVPSVGLVLAHHGKLDTVDGEQLVQRQAEGHCAEDIDLDQSLAAGEVSA